MSFLTAEWRKLALANYAVSPAVLMPYLPAHTELDLWEDTCYVSLVGFMFLNTKLLGLPIPFHRNFEEVNLRFYVKHHDGTTWKRGVVFINEIVPKPALTFVANTLYKEHYETMQMQHTWEEQADHRMVTYGWRRGSTPNRFTIKAALHATDIPAGSETEFITEHYWGYTQAGPQKAFEYEVTHPRWQAYPVLAHHIAVDFGEVYGKDFNFLTGQTPRSVMLAEGSLITVENKRAL